MAEKIAVLTDSTCDLSLDYLRQRHIEMVPLSVFFGDEEYLDGIDLSTSQFYEKLSTSLNHPTTSQPPVGRFLKHYQMLKTQGYTHVLSLHISQKMSGTLQAARQASAMVSGMTVEVIDSCYVSLGLGLLVAYAQDLVDGGASFTTVVEQVRARRPLVKILFSVDSLDALHQGGRIGKAQALMGKLLGIKPLLTMAGATGEIEVLGKVLSTEAALKAMISTTKTHIAEHGIQQGIALIYAGVKSYHDKLETAILPLLKETGLADRLQSARIGAVVGAHLGPDGWGIILC